MPQPLRKPTPPEHLPAGSIDQMNLWAEVDQLVTDWKYQAELLRDTEAPHAVREAKIMARMAGQLGVLVQKWDDQYQAESAEYERKHRR